MFRLLLLLAMLLPLPSSGQEPDALQQGLEAAVAGDLEQAERALLRAVDEAPDDSARFAALFNLAGLLTEQGRKNDALARFAEAIAIVDRQTDGEPSAPLAARLQLAEALRRLGDPAGAEATAWECLALAADLPELAWSWPVARLLLLAGLQQGLGGAELAGLLSEMDLALSGRDDYRLAVRPPPEPIVDGIAGIGGQLMEAGRPEEAWETFVAVAALDAARGAMFRLGEDLVAAALAAADAGDAEALGWAIEHLEAQAAGAGALGLLRQRRRQIEVDADAVVPSALAMGHLQALGRWAAGEGIDDADLDAAGQFLFAARWTDDLAALAATHAWRDLAEGRAEDAREAAAHAVGFEEQLGLGDEGWRAAEVQLALDGYPEAGVRAWVHGAMEAGFARARLHGARRARWTDGGEATMRFLASATDLERAEYRLSRWAAQVQRQHGLRRGEGPLAPRTDAERALASARAELAALRTERRRVSFEGGERGPAGEREALKPAIAAAREAEAAAAAAVVAEDRWRGLLLTGRIDVEALQASLGHRALVVQGEDGQLLLSAERLLLVDGFDPGWAAARDAALAKLAGKGSDRKRLRVLTRGLDRGFVEALGEESLVLVLDPHGWLLPSLLVWPGGPAARHWASAVGTLPGQATPVTARPGLAVGDGPSATSLVDAGAPPTPLLSVARGEAPTPRWRALARVAAELSTPLIVRGAAWADADVLAFFGGGAIEVDGERWSVPAARPR